MSDTPSQWVVCALYKFVTLENFEQLRAPLHRCMQDNQVYGTLLLAHEGINGTIAGSRHGIDKVLAWLENDPRLNPLDYKESLSDSQPFKRCKVKLKKEIVTMGVEDIDPTKSVGTYVEPGDWDALLADPDVVLVDTRNDYEYQVGTFKNAINPNTESFREFPEYVKENLDPSKHKKIAMFCTGGIRCEKSTAFMKQQGFSEVYHLKGGILKYLEEVPEAESSWQGECFVFDDRVTVNHQLEPGTYHQCNACRMPITDEDMQHEHFVQGVSCPYCHDKTSAEQKARYAQREKQMQLAKMRNEAHIGAEAGKVLLDKKRQKLLRKKAIKHPD